VILWLAIGAMVALAVAMPLAALMRERGSDNRRDRELALYRRQLSELEEERATGLIDAAEANAARLEIERRMLRADTDDGGAGRSGQGLSRGVAAGLLVGAALAAVLGYMALGHPGLPSRPAGSVSADGAAQASNSEAEGTPSMAELTDRLAARLEDSPGRLDGWRLLGRTALNSGRPKLAADAFARALELAPEQAEFHSALGEALVAMAEGRVTPAAELAFRRARERAPADPAAGYYLGLAALQAGEPEQALSRWRDLLEAAPEQAPWRESIRGQIMRVERSLGQAAEPRSAPPAVTPEAMANAQDMTPAERQAMIGAMVDRLAARLEDNPDDYEGWLRLARARLVLGETAAAQAALERAEAAAPPELKDEIAAERERLSRQ